MRIWLICLGILVAAMIIVGGATRLTDSGLSITEWQLITGFVPPLNDAQWQDAFTKYQQIPEFTLINPDMTLAGFKLIYWWEWAHRFLGRIVGIVFAGPYLIFLIRRRIGSALNRRLLFILALGGLQGALGWYMVSSGLVDRVDVSQYRLAAHLGLAFLILAVIAWTYLGVSRPAVAASDGKGRRGALLLTGLVFVQILLGALVAGTDAGFSHNSWPLMAGKIIPDDLFVMAPWWINFFENVRTVQFDHRMVAYLLVVAACWHAAALLRANAKALGGSLMLAGLILLQAAIGIWTLVQVVPLRLGLLHQGMAILVLLAAIIHLHGFYGQRDYMNFQK
jgi:heme a synthase